jgi:hypothetical protein
VFTIAFTSTRWLFKRGVLWYLMNVCSGSQEFRGVFDGGMGRGGVAVKVR